MNLEFMYLDDLTLLTLPFVLIIVCLLLWLVRRVTRMFTNDARVVTWATCLCVTPFLVLLLIEPSVGYFRLKQACKNDGGLSIYEHASAKSIRIPAQADQQHADRVHEKGYELVELGDDRFGYTRYSIGDSDPVFSDFSVSELSYRLGEFVSFGSFLGGNLSYRDIVVEDIDKAITYASFREYYMDGFWLDDLTDGSGRVLNCQRLYPNEERYDLGLAPVDLGARK